MTAPVPMDVTAIYELPVPIWVTGTVLGETFPSGYGKLRFEVAMPQDQPPVGGAPAIDGVMIPTELSDGELVAWTTEYVANIPEVLQPATALRRIVITAVEAPTDPVRSWRGPDQQLGELVGFWFNQVRTWAEIFTGQDLDPGHRVFDAETIGAGLTFIEPPHEGDLGIRLTTRDIRPVSADEWQWILAAVRDDVEPPVVELLIRDARAAFARGFYRRAIIDAAAALEIALVHTLDDRIEELPEKQRGRLDNRPSLGVYISIAEISGFEFEVTFEELRRLVDSRNDAAHRVQAPNFLKTHDLLRIATDFLGSHGVVRRVTE